MDKQKLFKLTIYTDDTYTEVREVRERDGIKIPYRVGQHVIKALDGLNLKDNDAVLAKLLESEAQITAVVRATFGLKDEDLDFVDLLELPSLAAEIAGFIMDKVAELGAGEKVHPTAAQA